MSVKPLLVLFLSTGNAARSLLAEALLNAKGSERFRAKSAGFAPEAEIFPETRALLEFHAISTKALHPKGWMSFYEANALIKVDVIVTLSEEARLNCPVWPGDPVRVHWAVDNPLSAARPDVREWKFKKCYSTLEARINTLVRSRPAPSACELFLQLREIGMVV